MRIAERRLRYLISEILKEFVEDDTEQVIASHGEDGEPSKWKNSFDQEGWINKPQNFSQYMIIQSAIAACKSYCEENNCVSIEDLPKISRDSESEIPYVLSDLKTREMGDYSKKLFDSGFARVAIKIGGYREDTGEHRNKLYEVHLYLNPKSRQCAHAKIKNQGWSRPKGMVGWEEK